MRKTLIILFLIQSIISFAQNNDSKNYGKIVYERILNFDNNPKVVTFNLFFNPNFSVFTENRKEPKKNAVLMPSSDDESDLTLNVKFNGRKYIVLTNFIEDSIECQVSLFRDGEEKTYIVEEKINKINWTILNEFKEISNMKAQKAIGDFRGRKYIAWFTNEIPVKYGPWKLNGLPGLILSVTDNKNEVSFNATSVKIPHITNSETTETIFEFNYDFERISLAEYIQYKKQQVKEVEKLLNSKLPRGAIFITGNSNSNDIELVY